MRPETYREWEIYSDPQAPVDWMTWRATSSGFDVDFVDGVMIALGEALNGTTRDEVIQQIDEREDHE